jgi:hypothetical protein
VLPANRDSNKTLAAAHAAAENHLHICIIAHVLLLRVIPQQDRSVTELQQEADTFCRCRQQGSFTAAMARV